MKTFKIALMFVLVALLTVSLANAEEMTKQYTLWLGAHSMDFTDYARKVGEFDNLESTTRMAGGFEYLSYGLDRRFTIKTDYFHDKDYSIAAAFAIGTHSSGKVSLRTYERQLGQDQLTNMAAREWLGTAPGGKMVTHDLSDAGAEYTIERKEINSEFNMLVSHASNIRLYAAHKSILKDGHDQVLANSHCATCHIVSKTGTVDSEQHQIMGGVQAELARMTLGYEIGYRKFESKSEDPIASYDYSSHPVTGASHAEFTTRLVFDDADLPARTSPTTEKVSHKFRFKGDAGKGRISGSVRYFKAKNKDTDLEYDGWAGAFNYVNKLSAKTRLVAKVNGSKFDSDTITYDMPAWRDGRSGYSADIFDYHRASSLNRSTGMISAEMFHRLNQKTNGSLLLGYEKITRNNYPSYEADESSSQIFTQLRIKHRASEKLNASLKYRLEMTSDQWVSKRGLFESQGFDVLHPLPGESTWIYYFQREDLRYQNITSAPTQKHEIDVNFGWHPSAKYIANFGVKFESDKNDDLDSLDVKHSMMRPNFSLTGMPSDKLMFTAGFSYNHYKSTGPVTVALFDG